MLQRYSLPLLGLTWVQPLLQLVQASREPWVPPWELLVPPPLLVALLKLLQEWWERPSWQTSVHAQVNVSKGSTFLLPGFLSNAKDRTVLGVASGAG
mmetsp:Transcript_6283/g.39104  ORF Transcript_6283/g.39104 Transcript_6283/m.39104 type:complete len:97 (+) Transcript_6283:1826-2116(+)